MSWSSSNGNAYYIRAMGANTVKPTTDTFNVALYASNSMTPVQSTTASATQYASGAWVTGNEVSSTNYTAGGTSVSSPTFLQSANVITFTSAGTPTWTTVSFTAYGCLVYDTQSGANDQAISWNWFSGAQTVASGVFSIAWAGAGILAITC